MKDIAKMSFYLEKSIRKRVIPKLIKATQETIEQIHSDVKANAPIRSGVYASSIKYKTATFKDNVISAEVYSDLLVGGDNPKWANLPLACFIEWGTGIVGANSNTFNHGFPYTMNSWTYYDKYLHKFIKTKGQIARPHFYPALQNNVGFFKSKIKEAFK